MRKQTEKNKKKNPLPQAAMSANPPKIQLQDRTKRPNESRKDGKREKEIEREQEKKTVIKTQRKLVLAKITTTTTTTTTRV